MKKNGLLCAVDVNDFDQDVIDLAGMMAKQFGVDLDLLHVTLFPNTANRSRYAYVGEFSVYRKERRLLEKITTSVGGVKINPHQLQGNPAEQVLGFAARNRPRLLVLGTHGRQGLSRIMGSVASRILRNACCPVMVMRQRQNDQDFEELVAEAESELSTDQGNLTASPCDQS